MKKILIILLLIGHNVSFGQYKYCEYINELLEKTPNGYLPFSTTKFDYNKSIKLDNLIVNNCFLNNDSNKLTYILRYYDNDLQQNISEIKYFNFRTIAKYNLDSIDVVLYSRLGDDIMQIMMVTFLKNELIDQLIIGYIKGGGDTDVIKYTEGVIENNFSVKTKACIRNPEYTIQKRKEIPDFPKSLVTLSEFKVDTVTGKITLLKSEEKYSKCSPEEFSYKNNDCELF